MSEVYNLISSLNTKFKRLSILGEYFVKFNPFLSKLPLQCVDALSVYVVVQQSHLGVLTGCCETSNDTLGNIVCTVYDNKLHASL